MARHDLGECNCLNCSKTIPASKTDNGHIAFTCGWCKFQHYAPNGSKSFRDLMEKINTYASETPTAAAPIVKTVVVPKQVEKQEQKPVEKTIFDHILGLN